MITKNIVKIIKVFFIENFIFANRFRVPANLKGQVIP